MQKIISDNAYKNRIVYSPYFYMCISADVATLIYL